MGLAHSSSSPLDFGAAFEKNSTYQISVCRCWFLFKAKALQPLFLTWVLFLDYPPPLTCSFLSRVHAIIEKLLNLPKTFVTWNYPNYPRVTIMQKITCNVNILLSEIVDYVWNTKAVQFFYIDKVYVFNHHTML